MLTRKGRVLLGEDDLSLSYVIKDNLVDAGYEVIVCPDGQTAIDQFEKLLKEDKNGISKEVRSIAHMNLGLAYYDLNDDFEVAKRELVQAINIDPNNPHSYYNLGVLYYTEEGSIEKAKKFIKK